jgi:hypothetical protein
MIINYFKSKSDLLEEIDILKTKLLINKNLVGRFEDCYESKKTIPTKTTRKFIKNLKSQLR